MKKGILIGAMLAGVAGAGLAGVLVAWGVGFVADDRCMSLPGSRHG